MRLADHTTHASYILACHLRLTHDVHRYCLTGGQVASRLIMVVEVERALQYQEPGIVTILILSSFLYLLNFVNRILDSWIYCGLLGQVFIGIAFGVPGAQWLTVVSQQVFTQLGYLALILLVYEGSYGHPHPSSFCDK